MPTREPNLEPRRDTMCFLEASQTLIEKYHEDGSPNVGCHDFAMGVVGMGKDVLDQVIAILVAGNCMN